MPDMLLPGHPALQSDKKTAQLTIVVDGKPVTVFAGENLAAALWVRGFLTLGRDPHGAPHGFYCGMGHCFSCRVTLDGVPEVRACLVTVSEGQKIDLGDAHGL